MANNELRVVLGELLFPFKEYWNGLSKWNNLDSLVQYIDSQGIFSASVIRYLLGAAVISTIIGRILSYDEGTFVFFDIPIIDEIFGLFLIYVGSYLSALITHKIVKRFGTDREFRHTFLATLYVTATAYPLITLLEGAFNILEGSVPSEVKICYSFAQLFYLSLLLGKIHNIPQKKLYIRFAVVTAYLMFVVLIFGVAVYILFGMDESQDNAETAGQTVGSSQFPANYPGESANREGLQYQKNARIRICNQLRMKQIREDVSITVGGATQTINIDSATPTACVDFFANNIGSYNASFYAISYVENQGQIVPIYMQGQGTITLEQLQNIYFDLGANFSTNPPTIFLQQR